MPTKQPKPRRPRKRFSFWRFLLLLFFIGGAFFSGLGYWGYKQFEKDLPERWSALTNYRPARASRVFSAEGELIGEFFLQKRIVIPPSDLPEQLRQAFVAAEDNRFYDHHGIDPLGIVRAAIANARAGRVVQGGSTITQQVAKLMLVGNERNLFRKIREAILAHKIEARLSKDQILAIYLNHVYLGHGAYGVQAASEIYFAKNAKDLTLGEAAMLGGLPKAPTEDSPFSAFKRAKDRQHYVLGQMVENNFVTAKAALGAENESLAIVSKDTPLNHLAAPYFVEFIRRMVQAKYAGRELYDRGLRIHTTVSMKEQRAAEAAVKHGLDAVDHRFGFRGPVGHLDDKERAQFLEGMPQPYIGEVSGASRGASEVGCAHRGCPSTIAARIILKQTSGVLIAGRPYLAIPEKSGKKTYARIGALRVLVDDYDAGRIWRWTEGRTETPTGDRKGEPIVTVKTERKRNRLLEGDLIAVGIKKIEKKKRIGAHYETEITQVAELMQKPIVEGALVALDPQNGHLTAMVGGYDYDFSQFNRATQARRQAGSSIKPYIYSAALEHGFTEVSIVPDAPVKVKTAAGFWSPHNYKAEYLGPITLRTALQKSINTVSVRLVEAIGVDGVIEQIRKYGIAAPIVRHPSIALGTPEVTLMEHSYGYATFPALGLEVKPVFIAKILDADGNIVEQEKAAAPRRRIPDDTAYVMVDLMKNVVEKGTGQKAKELGRPAAGKTGTSNDFRDNWFMAFTRDRVCGVWVGRDDFHSIGFDATGGTTAAPIWTEFMKAAHPATPVRDFEVPPSVYFVRVSPKRGYAANPGAPESILVPFKRGTLPREFAAKQKIADFSDETF